jgi:wyosine [tRNA(Phe)-imidazoG37] synthetase (radical SAM superfamily)
MSRNKRLCNGNLITDHRRQWRRCRYVYPVISRRARGLSIGVNLNTDKRCNFGCLYCQINRRIHQLGMDIEIPRLGKELSLALAEAVSGGLWNEERFAETPAEFRRINDIAFSGDGEPTCMPAFDRAVDAADEALSGAGLAGTVKIVVITNGTNLISPQVRRALPSLDANGGEFWIKLDAGTEKFFRLVNHPAPKLTLQTICDNILVISVARPVVIQTLFFRIDGKGPSQEEIDAYCGRLRWLIGNGGRVKLVQLHTIARRPTSSRASALPDEALDKIGRHVQEQIGDVPVEVFPGRDVPPQDTANE